MIVALENIKMRALALRSSVHNEHQLSAIELTAMCAKKTNELIDVVNDLCAIVDAQRDYMISIGYDPSTESLTIGGKAQ